MICLLEPDEGFMPDNPAAYVGSIPEEYDRNLGPLLFADYAADISRRVATCQPRRVLEIAAGTGIVTRQLRNLLPDGVELTATDLNPPMLEIAAAQNKIKSTRVASVPGSAGANLL